MVTAKKTIQPTTNVAPTPKAPAKKSVAAKAPVADTLPVAAKAAVRKSPAKTAAPAKASSASAADRAAVSVDQRHHYIEVAAFYVAQRRGFTPGNPTDDWAMAEVEVDQLILSGHFSK